MREKKWRELPLVKCDELATRETRLSVVVAGAGYESCSSRSASQSPATSHDAACQTSSRLDDIVTSSSSHHQPASAPLSTSLSMSCSRTSAVNGCGTAVRHSGSLSQRSVNCGHGVLTTSHLRHRHATGQHLQRSLSTLTPQHHQLVQSMMRMLDIDGLDLSKHPYTNYVSIPTLCR